MINEINFENDKSELHAFVYNLGKEKIIFFGYHMVRRKYFYI
jgi:hypothetical protein